MNETFREQLCHLEDLTNDERSNKGMIREKRFIQFCLAFKVIVS